MAFLDKVIDFLKERGVEILIGLAVLGVVGYLIDAYMTGKYPWGPGPVVPPPVKNVSFADSSKKAVLSPNLHDDDFQYIDLSSSVVVPVTDPTNDVQSFTKHVDENGQVTWEPNVMMDPIDILGQEEFDRAIDAARPTMSEQQLKRLTTPAVLQRQGNLFWGTPWPEGGPGTDRACITKDDIVHKGVFSNDSTHGTFGAGPC